MEDIKPIALWLALLSLFAWGACMQIEARGMSQKTGLLTSCCYKSGQAILNLELASSSRCFQEVLAQGTLEENARVARINTYMDFVFIGLYWAVFVLFAVTYRAWQSGWIVVLISAAAIFDLLENYRILRGLAV